MGKSDVNVVFGRIDALMGRLTQAWAADRTDFDDRSWLPAYIARKNAGKALRRRSASLKLMSHYRGLYDCKRCIHGLVGSCVDALPDACEYFSDEVRGIRFMDTLGVQVKKRYRRPRKRSKAKRYSRHLLSANSR